jgi:hypothetical protein
MRRAVYSNCLMGVWIQMRIKSYTRVLLSGALVLALTLVLAGCGDNSGTETGQGAPAGATGDQAGGAAVEAGKQRNPADVKNEQQAYGTEPPPVQIDLGESSGWNVAKTTVVVVNSNSELKSVKKKLQSKYSDTSEIVPIDFKTRQLIVLQMPKSPPGTAVQITQVKSGEGTITVEATKITRGKGCKGGRSTNPFHIVETRKLTGTPKLKLSTMANDPCN